ncbi:hypothetical protein VP01_3730g6 [Puccinia sorghi]|uniref:Uncharacterized protein n=1 Tax=Puccinia sorghi TaxID=27349 RepID=A0A0L6UVW8_9BASI|nr:hypothetical protein VP01_3730g6 [Puccinia sorghi]
MDVDQAICTTFTSELVVWPLIAGHGGSLGRIITSHPPKLFNNPTHDPTGRSQLLSVEAQMRNFHVFMTGKETAEKACGRFVNAVIKKAG